MGLAKRNSRYLIRGERLFPFSASVLAVWPVQNRSNQRQDDNQYNQIFHQLHPLPGVGLTAYRVPWCLAEKYSMADGAFATGI